MGLESATFVSELDQNNPAGSDQQSQGDNHLRLIKAALLTTFPNASKPFYFPSTVALATGTVNVLSTDDNKVFPVSASGAARTVNLPALTSAEDGFTITVIKTDATANAVTIDANGSELINGALTQALTTQYQMIQLTWCNTLGTWIAFGRALDVINDLTTGGTAYALSAEMGKSLKALVDLRTTIASIVNDLTTGGTAVPLSAEMGKTLKTQVDGKSSTSHNHSGTYVEAVRLSTKTDVTNDDLGNLINGVVQTGFITVGDGGGKGGASSVIRYKRTIQYNLGGVWTSATSA